MSFFGYVKHTGALNEVVNFETFGRSFVLLFRLMTSAGWNDILDPLMIAPPDCDPNYKGLSNGNCGNKVVAMIYFGSFITVIFLILINMYIAIILENYNQAQEQEKIGITNEDFDSFYQEWETYDPHATQYIKYNQLSDFVDGLEGNLRIKKPNRAACALLNIPLVNDEDIHCLDILQALVKRVVTGFEGNESEEFKLVLQQMEERFTAAYPQRKKHLTTVTTMERNAQVRAAMVISRAIRSYKERKKLAALIELKNREKMEEEEPPSETTEVETLQTIQQLPTSKTRLNYSKDSLREESGNEKGIPLLEIEQDSVHAAQVQSGAPQQTRNNESKSSLKDQRGDSVKMLNAKQPDEDLNATDFTDAQVSNEKLPVRSNEKKVPDGSTFTKEDLQLEEL